IALIAFRSLRSLSLDSHIVGSNKPVSIFPNIWGQPVLSVLSVLSVLALQFFKGDQILPGILSHPSPLESVKSFLDFNFPTVFTLEVVDCNEIVPSSFPYIAPTDVIIDGKLNLSTIRAVFTILTVLTISTFEFRQGNQILPGFVFSSPFDEAVFNNKFNLLGIFAGLSIFPILPLDFFKGDKLSPGRLSNVPPK